MSNPTLKKRNQKQRRMIYIVLAVPIVLGGLSVFLPFLNILIGVSAFGLIFWGIYEYAGPKGLAFAGVLLLFMLIIILEL